MSQPPVDGQLIIMDIDWPKFSATVQEPLFAEIVLPAEDYERDTAARGELKRRLADLDFGQRRRALGDYLEQQLTQTLGLRPGEPVDMAAGFFDLGLDSLMGMELKGRLEQALDTRLQAALLIDAGNLQELSDMLLQLLTQEWQTAEHKANESAEQAQPDAAVVGQSLQALKADELEAMLSASLDDIDEVLR